MIRVVTDSTADIPEALMREWDLAMVPLLVQFGDETLRDRVDITHQEFMRRLVGAKVLPTTSQPTPSAFEEQLLRQSDGVLGAVKLRTERQSFPLQKLTAHRFTAHRCALIGDAAHVVHPLAGQGVNLGLLDAAALCELICAAWRVREDPGAQSVLRRYERWRKSEIEPIALAIDGFNRYLAHGVGPLSRIAQRGLALVNRTDEVKRFFITRALGLGGELPKVARHPLAPQPPSLS